MAYDISTDKTTPDDDRAPLTFEEFHDTYGHTLARALALACDDDVITSAALTEGLVKTSQQWKRVGPRPDVLGWAFHAGVDHADKTLSETSPTAMNEATGGYLRGLPIEEAIRALPLQQRAALVAAHYLGWSDRRAGVAMGIREETVSTRRTRAINFLAHHLQTTPAETTAIVVDRLRTIAADLEPNIPESAHVRRAGRRLTMRNRAGAGLLAIAFIAGGATLVQVGRQSTDPVEVGPEPIAAPGNSSDWLPPVADGSGGFMALNTSGASRFARSTDGLTWFEHSVWNSRAIDLRTEVTSFSRSGGRYIATLETVAAVSDPVAPRIAISTDLVNWQVEEIDVGLIESVEGLRFAPSIVNAAAAGSRLIVAVEVAESTNYRALGLQRADVCVEVTFDAVQALYLCDGQVITIDRPAELVATSTRYWLSEDDRPFVPIVLPDGTNARSLVSYGTGFAVADFQSGVVSISEDGRTWARSEMLDASNRFVLIEGDSRGQALAVVPAVGRWQSDVFQGAESAPMSDVGLQLDPSVVWTKPELVAGPAGWALFVSTSRSWERGDVTPGWAVDTGTWVVSRLPDSNVVTAQNRARTTTYRFSESSDALQFAADGAVTLALPDTDQEVIRVTRAQIDQSRAVTSDEEKVKAEVFFSADGQTWRSIWQSDDDTWFGSVAVGDDEVLISGATLTGAPISVPLS